MRATSGIATDTVTVAVGQKCPQAFDRNAYRNARLAGEKSFEVAVGKQAPDGALAEL